jgi:hypothetical protein
LISLQSSIFVKYQLEGMKKISILGFVILFSLHVLSQDSLWPPIDNSPMDMSYFPVNYPLLKINKAADAPLVMRVIYSRPQKKDREVFGGLLEYGQVWRLGANEATEIEFFRDVKIEGNKVKKGKYSMYAIPYENKWTIILNKETDTWGAFAYDSKKDILRVDVKTEKNSGPAEVFSMVFSKTGTGANLMMTWDNVKTFLPISF